LVTRQILNRNVVLLAVTFSTMVSNFNALAIWLPQIVRGMVGPGAPYWQVGLIAAIPPFCTLCAIPFWSRRSDRRKERLHCIGPLMVAVAGWALAAELAGAAWRGSARPRRGAARTVNAPGLSRRIVRRAGILRVSD
jgi:MFS family permease